MSSVIDLASIANAVSALDRGRDKQWRQWTAWDKYALGQVTLGLLLYGQMQMTSRGESRGGAMGDVLRILSAPVHGQVTVSSVARTRGTAISATRRWIAEEEGMIRSAVKIVMSDSNFDAWIDWVIRCTWEDTIRQDGSLLDDRFTNGIATVLQWSAKETRKLEVTSGNRSAVRAWAARPLSPPPVELVQGFVLSALLRGRLIEVQAEQASNHYAFHPLREPVLTPIAQGRLKGHCVPHSARRLAAIIVSSALMHRTLEEGASSWAHNILKVRGAMHYENAIGFSHDKDENAAVDEAVKIARDLELQIEWRLVKPIQDEIATLGGFKELVGFVLAPIMGYLPAKVAKWAVIETLGPGVKRLLESTAEALQRNPFLLRKLAGISEKGPGKIFAGTAVGQ